MNSVTLNCKFVNVSIWIFVYEDNNRANLGPLIFIVIIEKEPKMSLFTNNWDTFAVLSNELIGNIVQVNIKYIYIF